jgi:hypothetical protein
MGGSHTQPSLRIVNWIKWALSNGDMQSEFRNSLAVQAHWLSRKIERYVLGNHLLANAKALVFAGLFFNVKEAEQWLATGLDILACLGRHCRAFCRIR